MNSKIFVIVLCTLFVLSCENDKLANPVATYDIQYFNTLKNEWVNMEKPYKIVLSERKKIRVISGNSSLYNSFYLGDSIRSGTGWIKRIYSPKPNRLYQGLALVFDNNLKRGVVNLNDINGKLLYSDTGKFNVTFVASEVANYGEEIAIKVNDKEFIEVLP